MPCALTSDADYPDYLKKILKEIDVGDDEKLKACACKLVTPLTDEGCEILDEDKKLGAFPFCIPLVENGVGDNTDYPLKLTLKQAMNLYWETTTWNFVAFANGASNCSCSVGCGATTEYINYSGSKRITSGTSIEIESAPPKKNLVCPNYFEYLSNFDGQRCAGDCIQLVGEDQIVASAFAGDLPLMRMKKEGNIYYFYPKFTITVGAYPACASIKEEYAAECLQARAGVKDGSSLSVPITILGESCFPLKMYTKIYADTASDGVFCSKSGNVNISTLTFDSITASATAVSMT